MRIDRELQAKMEGAMVARADSGPNANPPVSQRTKPRASEISKGCARISFYTLTGAEPDPRTPASASATTLGEAIEADVLRDLEAAIPGEWRQQVKVENEWVKGTADGVRYVLRIPLTEPPTGKTWDDAEADLVVDSKSANTASWEIKERQGACGDEIEAQLQIYMHLTGASEGIAVFRKTGGNAKDMDKGVYLPIRFPYRPEVVERMEKIARAAMAARETGIAPPRAFKQTDWQCQYCNYKGTCWPKENA